jgi:hypothetical protein
VTGPADTIREARSYWKVRAEAAEAALAAANERADQLAAIAAERDALAELQPFPVETVMAWKRRVDDVERRLFSAELLLDPERQDEPDEENALRAFEMLTGLRPPRAALDRHNQEATEDA